MGIYEEGLCPGIEQIRLLKKKEKKSNIARHVS